MSQTTGAIHYHATAAAPTASGTVFDLRARVLAVVIVIAATLYATAAVTAAAVASARPVTVSGVATVFFAGAVPGLLVTLLLWGARPAAFRRPLLRQMVFVGLGGAVVVAVLPAVLSAVAAFLSSHV